MKTSIAHTSPFLPPDLCESLADTVDRCLQSIATVDGRFIVNDTICFRKAPSGRQIPCVMNNSDYLPLNFKRHLATQEGCQSDAKVGRHTLDGLITARTFSPRYRLRDHGCAQEVASKYLSHIGLKETDHTDRAGTLARLCTLFGNRWLHDISALPQDVHALFESQAANVEGFALNVGIEVAVERPAAAMKSIDRLSQLFMDNHIAAGILITPTDRSSASRTWTTLRKRASIDRLEALNYLDYAICPLITVGFAPDDYSSQAPFLGTKGEVYELTPTGNTGGGGRFRVMTGEFGKTILRPIGI